jgi:hypothetical protein
MDDNRIERYNFRKYLRVDTKDVPFVRVPVNFTGITLSRVNGKVKRLPMIPYTLQRLYIQYLDCKAQTSEGIFTNFWSRKRGASNRQHYRRVISALLKQGWARPCTNEENGDIALRSYRYVWRQLGIERFRVKDRRKFFDQKKYSSGEQYSDFKIYCSDLSDDRKTYYQQIKNIIHKKLTDRKCAQIRWRLKKGRKHSDITQATFGAESAALLFGYRSSSSGSKLRKKNFSVLPSNGKPKFLNGEWREPCKLIAL